MTLKNNVVTNNMIKKGGNIMQNIIYIHKEAGTKKWNKNRPIKGRSLYIQTHSFEYN